MDKSIQITATLDDLLVGKLKSVATADSRSMSWLIAQACREFIAKPENVTKWMQHTNAQRDLPLTTAQRQAKARKGMAARSERLAKRMSKPK